MIRMATASRSLPGSAPWQGLPSAASRQFLAVAITDAWPSAEDGQDFAEYALVMALVVAVSISAVVLLGSTIDTFVTSTIGALIAMLP